MVMMWREIQKWLKIEWNKLGSPWSMIIYSGFEGQEVRANYIYHEKGDKILLLLAAVSPYKFPTHVVIRSRKYVFEKVMPLKGVPNPLLNPYSGAYVSKLYYYLLAKTNGEPETEQEPEFITEQEYKLLSEGAKILEF